MKKFSDLEGFGYGFIDPYVMKFTTSKEALEFVNYLKQKKVSVRCILRAHGRFNKLRLEEERAEIYKIGIK